MQRRRLLPSRRLAAIVLCIAGAVVVILWARPWRTRTAILPEIDLSAAHPEIASVIRQAQDDVRRHPASDLSWGRLGMVLMAHGLNGQALECFRQAADRDDRQFRWRYYMAAIEEIGDLEQALGDYESAAALNPIYAPVRWRAAIILMKLGRTAEAEKRFQEAARLAPKSQYPWLGLARLALSRGDREMARAHFQEAADLAPWDRTSHAELARVCFLMGDLDAAAGHHEQAAQLPEASPEMPDPVLQGIDELKAGVLKLVKTADHLAASGNLAAAVDVYREVVQLRPELARPRLNLGITLQRQGDLRGAVATYRDVLHRFPQDILAHYQLALALGLLNDIDASIRSYHNCITIKPDFAPAYHGLGLMLKKLGDIPGAARAQRQAVNADPQLAAAHLSLGRLEQEQGNFDAAIHELECAVRLAPDDTVAQACLRRVLEEQRSHIAPDAEPNSPD